MTPSQPPTPSPAPEVPELADAPLGHAWKCPDCGHLAALSENATYHRNVLQHGQPSLAPFKWGIRTPAPAPAPSGKFHVSGPHQSDRTPNDPKDVHFSVFDENAGNLGHFWKREDAELFAAAKQHSTTPAQGWMELARKEVDSALSYLPKEFVIQHDDPFAAMALTFAKLGHAVRQHAPDTAKLEAEDKWVRDACELLAQRCGFPIVEDRVQLLQTVGNLVERLRREHKELEAEVARLKDEADHYRKQCLHEREVAISHLRDLLARQNENWSNDLKTVTSKLQGEVGRLKAEVAFIPELETQLADATARADEWEKLAHPIFDELAACLRKYQARYAGVEHAKKDHERSAAALSAFDTLNQKQNKK